MQSSDAEVYMFMMYWLDLAIYVDGFYFVLAYHSSNMNYFFLLKIAIVI